MTAGYEDIYELGECVAAGAELGFPVHDSIIKDTTLLEQPHGCTIQNNGLIRLYTQGVQACLSTDMNYCLCKYEGN